MADQVDGEAREQGSEEAADGVAQRQPAEVDRALRRVADEADQVVEGDVLRAVAVEGEWLYGMLMKPVMGKNPSQGEYEPATVEDVVQIGWVPLSYTDKMSA